MEKLDTAHCEKSADGSKNINSLQFSYCCCHYVQKIVTYLLEEGQQVTLVEQALNLNALCDSYWSVHKHSQSCHLHNAVTPRHQLGCLPYLQAHPISDLMKWT